MRINGQPIDRYVGEFKFYRRDGEEISEYAVKVKTLPPGWRRDAYSIFPQPIPPMSDRLTKIHATGRLEPVPNLDDPGYLDELDAW